MFCQGELIQKNQEDVPLVFLQLVISGECSSIHQQKQHAHKYIHVQLYLLLVSLMLAAYQTVSEEGVGHLDRGTIVHSK